MFEIFLFVLFLYFEDENYNSVRRTAKEDPGTLLDFVPYMFMYTIIVLGEGFS